MIVDEFTQNIKLEILQNVKMRIKQEIEPEIQNLNCNQCNLQKFSIINFTNTDDSVVTHLKCTNCGFESDFTVHLEQSGLDKGLDDVNTELTKFQNTIENINRKLKK